MFMAEKGMEMFKQTVDLRSGENRQVEHLKRNPHGRIPTLGLDDGSYLSLRARRLPRPQDDRGDFGGQVGQPLHPANANIAAWVARVGQRPSVKA
jgi:glutathione S-transferase